MSRRKSSADGSTVQVSKAKDEQSGPGRGMRTRAQGNAMRDGWARILALLANWLGEMGAVCAGPVVSALTGLRRGHRAQWAWRLRTWTMASGHQLLLVWSGDAPRRRSVPSPLAPRSSRPRRSALAQLTPRSSRLASHHTPRTQLTPRCSCFAARASQQGPRACASPLTPR